MSIFEESNDGPDEWIMHPVTRNNLGLPKELDSAREMVYENPQLLVDRMSHNSHRKIMYSHLGTYCNLPKGIPVIHLIRKDSWAQAKSFWVMKQEVIPVHVSQEQHSEVSKEKIELVLDYKQIEKWAKRFYKQKQIWYQVLKKRPDTLLLYYEDDVVDNKVFIEKTLPRIERFLNKNKKIKDYQLPLKKTRNLYTITNLNAEKEKKLTQKYYFKPTFKYWLRHYLKLIWKGH